MKMHLMRYCSITFLGLVFSATAFLANTSWAQDVSSTNDDMMANPAPVAAQEVRADNASDGPTVDTNNAFPIAVTNTAQVHSPAQDLKITLNQFFNQNPALGDSLSGAYIKVLDSERVLYSYHGSEPLVPASNLKIVTTATALDLLGPDYKFTTELWGAPVGANGVLSGDLYLRGNGDPSNTPPYQETATSLYERFADALEKAGVREILGDIVADDSLFDREYYPEGWADHYHLDSYSAPVSGLSLNGNLVEVRINGNGAQLFPPNDSLQLAYSDTGAYNTAVERERGSNTVLVRGPLSNINREITVDNPPLFAASAFAHVLANRGIKIDGKVRLIRQLGEPASVTAKYKYASASSPSLQELITEINQQSDNFLAEHLFKAVGARYAGQGNARTGNAAIKRFLTSQGIDTTGLHMVDGCGLSELNRITPNQLADTLTAMAHHKYAKIFYDSLASNEHGTLRYRIPGTDIHGKTGTLNHFTALSGYVTNVRGQVIAFSLIFNKLNDVSVGIDIQNRIVTMLAQWDETL